MKKQIYDEKNGMSYTLHIGTGCLIAWAIWFVMFILLLIDRHKRES